MVSQSDGKNKSKEPPAPELLSSQFKKNQKTEKENQDKEKVKSLAFLKSHHGTYRPSHKATFIGIAVVVGILAINVGVIFFIIKAQNVNPATVNSKGEVTISPAVLNTLGVSRNTVGKADTELIVAPNSSFKGKVIMANDVSISGQLNLNGKFSAADVSLTKLTAGDTSLEKLNVNGDATISNLNLRRDLTVAGASHFQGAVTVSQLLTVNNNVNIVGNLAIGGTLSARSFQASNLVSDTTLTIGGHIITRGSAPSFTRGSALRASDTVSVSGNDASGTVAVNIGAGSIGAGCLATISFSMKYSNIPHVVVTPVGPISNVYVFRNTSGFSVCTASPLSYGGYAFDYIVMQ